MSGIKGMKMYPQGVREKILTEYKNGVSQCELSRRYGISRYAIQCWIGARPEKIYYQNNEEENQQKHCKNISMRTNG